MARLPTGPYKTGRTGCYGCTRSTPSDGGCGVHGYPCTHYGIDLFATSPDVFAPETGVVVAVSDGQSAPFVGYNPGVILLLGASGYFHLLGHLNSSTISVKPGMTVIEGQHLAQFDREIGHTHWEVRRQATGPSETNAINPLTWLLSQQRKAVAATKPSTTGPSAKTVLTGVAIAAGFVGASWLALRIAKSAAKASARPHRLPLPAT